MGYDALLNKICTIQVKSDDYTTNEDGTSSETWPDTYEDVPCALDKRSASYKELEMGINPASTHILFLKISQTVDRGNRVVQGGVTYFIEDKDDPAGRGHHLEIGIRLLEV